MIIQLSISRQREYLADATGAEILGAPDPLADALESLERGAEAIPMKVNPSAEPLYIVNPLRGGGVAGMFATHPPIPSASAGSAPCASSPLPTGVRGRREADALSRRPRRFSIRAGSGLDSAGHGGLRRRRRGRRNGGLRARCAPERGPARTVCLLEAGPDHGPLADGGWPDDLLDPRYLPDSHDWGGGGEDGRSLGARVLGGSSAHNACIDVVGTPGDYDEWGPAWAWSRFAPLVERAGATLRRASAPTPSTPSRSTRRSGPRAPPAPAAIDDANDPARPSGSRRSRPTSPAACASTRRSPTSTPRAAGQPARCSAPRSSTAWRSPDGGSPACSLADGRRVDAALVVLAAGAYLTPALLLRSGIGPEESCSATASSRCAILPVGERLLDHCGTGFAWEPSPRLAAETRGHVAEHGEVFEPHRC